MLPIPMSPQHNTAREPNSEQPSKSCYSGISKSMDLIWSEIYRLYDGIDQYFLSLFSHL